MSRNSSYSRETLYAIHATMPMMYMIDTAPLFLGLFAFFAGKYRLSKEIYNFELQTMVLHLEETVDIRTLELQKANTSLEQQNQEIHAFAQKKIDFLAHMSHEIRTPLNAIIGMANITKKLLKPPIQEKKANASIDQLVISSQHLLGLINNILDFSKIEANEFELNNHAFSLHDMLNECMQIMHVRGEEKDIALVLDCMPCEDVYLDNDKLRLMQVLLNLLSNSIKFTPKHGQVTLFVRVNAHSAEKLSIYFSIQDTGIGIPIDKLPTLFNSFKQAHTFSEGTGLGLSISQKIIQAFGGTIEVTSEENVGSQFYFTLLLCIASEKPEEATQVVIPLESFAGKRLLLADDIPVNRLIVTELLNETGLILDMAENGQEVVHAFEQSPPGFYQGILMDIQMPIMNGYTATELIRTSTHPDGASIPIIAMTANAMPEDIQKTKTASMNAHLSKPIDFTSLISTLFQFVGQKEHID